MQKWLAKGHARMSGNGAGRVWGEAEKTFRAKDSVGNRGVSANAVKVS